MPFYRRALEDLAATRDQDIGTLARRDPAYAARTLETYTGLYDTLLRQAQDQFVADAREQLLFQYKIDNSLHALSELSPALPRSSDSIADTTFQLAQLRSFGRLTLATLAAQLAHENIDAQSRFGVERFFSLSTQTGVWLRGLLDMLRVAPGAPPPDGETLWKAFFTLDVFYNETTREFAKYTAFVRQKAPGVAELATPRPLPVREFQRRLRSGEAIVATLVTPRDLYVWAITPDKVVLSRQRISEDEVRNKVQRLRAGLVPAGSGGHLPPFDAAAAYELYRLVFEPIAKTLQGVTDVMWFGHGPLGAVPPAVLVAAPPAQAKLSTPAEFAATRFLLDRYAFAALADLSLFPWHRDHPPARRQDLRLLGVGAPLLTADEVAGGPRSRTYELAGGLDGKALADLPKLPESVDEMKGLAGVVATIHQRRIARLSTDRARDARLPAGRSAQRPRARPVAGPRSVEYRPLRRHPDEPRDRHAAARCRPRHSLGVQHRERRWPAARRGIHRLVAGLLHGRRAGADGEPLARDVRGCRAAVGRHARSRDEGAAAAGA
jgi:hypothetical protein